jgi:hypothetical protein
MRNTGAEDISSTGEPSSDWTQVHPRYERRGLASGGGRPCLPSSHYQDL